MKDYHFTVDMTNQAPHPEPDEGPVRRRCSGQAVSQAGTADVNAVRQAMYGSE